MKIISTKSTLFIALTLVLTQILCLSAIAQWDSQSPISPGVKLNAGQAFDAETFVVAGEPSAVIWGFRDEDNIFRMKHTRVAEDDGQLVDLHGFSPKSAAVIGSDGSVFISGDRGESWQQTAQLDAELVHIQFFNNETGFITAADGSIWRSTDGGENWAELLTQTGASWKTAVSVSGSSAVVAGTNGWFAYTTDAGASWSVEQYDEEVSFTHSGYDEGTVYLLDMSYGGTGIYTLPSDFSEAPELAFETYNFYYGLFDIRDGEVILYHHISQAIECAIQEIWAYRYADAGNGWELIDMFGFAGNARGVASIPDTDSYLRFGISGFANETTLGVVSLEDGVVAEAYALKPTQSTGQPIAADILQLIKTEDGIAAYAYKIYTELGMICDANYTFRMTENSRVWRTNLRSPIGETGFAALRESGSGLVFRRVWQTGGTSLSFTTDFAATLEPLDIQTPHKVVDAVWLDDAFLVAVGESGAILFYDGDDLTVAGYAGGPLSSITMLDADHAIAVGESGRAVHINRSGEITTLDAPTIEHLHSVFALDDLVFASGSAGTILRSTDAGDNWSEITTGTEADLFAIAMHESGNGLAVGASGTLLITTNGGLVWGEDAPLTDSSLRHILFADLENIWIAGDEGVLFYSDSGEFTSLADPVAVGTPGYIQLHQNYPNPFNPTTNVSYELNEAADVRLEVFNTLGQRVALLYDGPQRIGYHTIPFDGSRLTSGVYIVRMTAAGQTFTNKMLLMK